MDSAILTLRKLESFSLAVLDIPDIDDVEGYLHVVVSNINAALCNFTEYQ